MNEKSILKTKLLSLIKEMLFSRPEIKVPAALEDCILESLGWSLEPGADPQEDLTDFVKCLQDWVENKVVCSDSCENNKEIDLNVLVQSLNNAVDGKSKTDWEFFRTMSEIAFKLEQMISVKEKYLELTHNKCELQDFNVNILKQKLHFLKLQFLCKLYGESNNGLTAHLKLLAHLKNVVAQLKVSHAEAMELSEKYSAIQQNDEFKQLFKNFKELKKIEQRTEIIKQM